MYNRAFFGIADSQQGNVNNQYPYTLGCNKVLSRSGKQVTRTVKYFKLKYLVTLAGISDLLRTDHYFSGCTRKRERRVVNLDLPFHRV